MLLLWVSDCCEEVAARLRRGFLDLLLRQRRYVFSRFPVLLPRCIVPLHKCNSSPSPSSPSPTASFRYFSVMPSHCFHEVVNHFHHVPHDAKAVPYSCHYLPCCKRLPKLSNQIKLFQDPQLPLLRVAAGNVPVACRFPCRPPAPPGLMRSCPEPFHVVARSTGTYPQCLKDPPQKGCNGPWRSCCWFRGSTLSVSSVASIATEGLRSPPARFFPDVWWSLAHDCFCRSIGWEIALASSSSREWQGDSKLPLPGHEALPRVHCQCSARPPAHYLREDF